MFKGFPWSQLHLLLATSPDCAFTHTQPTPVPYYLCCHLFCICFSITCYREKCLQVGRPCMWKGNQMSCSVMVSHLKKKKKAFIQRLCINQQRATTIVCVRSKPISVHKWGQRLTNLTSSLCLTGRKKMHKLQGCIFCLM